MSTTALRRRGVRAARLSLRARRLVVSVEVMLVIAVIAVLRQL